MFLANKDVAWMELSKYEILQTATSRETCRKISSFWDLWGIIICVLESFVRVITSWHMSFSHHRQLYPLPMFFLHLFSSPTRKDHSHQNWQALSMLISSIHWPILWITSSKKRGHGWNQILAFLTRIVLGYSELLWSVNNWWVLMLSSKYFKHVLQNFVFKLAVKFYVTSLNCAVKLFKFF